MPDTAESFLADLDNPKPKGPDTAESFLADLDRATPDQAASVRAAIFGSEDPNAQPAPTEMVDLLLETRGHNARVESEAAKYGKELDREAFPGIFKAAPSDQALEFERMGGAEGYRKAERALALERMGGTPTVGQVVSEVNAAKQDARLAEDASALRREEAPWLIRHGARFAVGALEQAQAAGEYVRENLIRPAAPDIAEAMRGLGGRYGMTPEGTDAIRRDTPGVPGAIAEMAGQTAAFVPQVALGGVPGAAAVSTAAAGGDAMAGLETAVFLKTAGGLTRLFGGASQSVIRQVLAEGGAMTAAGVATRMGFHGDPGTLHQAGVDALTGLAFGIMGGSARAKEAAKQYRAALESGKTLDAAAIEAGIPPEKIRNIDLDAAMAEGQRQREAAKASVTPVEAPLERPPQSDVVARPAPEPTAPEKPVSVAPVAPDAPASKTLVGTDKRGKEVWDIRGRYYVKDGQGRYGAAHPQEVAEAKASAQASGQAPAEASVSSGLAKRRFGGLTPDEVRVALEATEAMPDLGKYSLREAAEGVVPGAQTRVDRIFDKNAGMDPGAKDSFADYVRERAKSEAADIYHSYDKLREMLRSEYGDRIPLFRAESPNKIGNKNTLNFMDTREGARKYVRQGSEPKERVLVAKMVPIEDIAAVHARGAYREFVVFNRESNSLETHGLDARAQPPAPESAAIEPRVGTPTAEVVKRPSILDAAEKAGYPGAKEAREALDAIPDSTTRWDPVRKEWTRDPVDFTEVEARPMEAAPAEAPAPRPSKQAERGALSLAPVGELVTDVARGVKRAFGSFISRVEALDTPAAKEAAAKAKVAADQTRAFRGEMGRELLAVEKLTGQPIVTEHGKAATTLATPEFVPGKTYAVSPLYDAMEGRSVPADPAQARIIKAGQALVSKRGELFQREGFQQYDAQTDTWAPFQNRGGEIAPRIMTPEFSEIIQAGPRSKAWRPTIEAFADLNNVPVSEVEAYFNSRHKEANGEGPEGASKRAQAEFKRGFDRVPVVVRVGGENFRLFETNPATYFRRLAEAGASRLGVVKAFGQDTGTQNPVSDLRERFRTETGKPEDFVALQRLLHGQSKDRPIVDPSSATGGLVRNLGRAWTGLKELLLSGSAVTNIPESLGSTRDVTGSLGLARAIFRAFRGSKDPINATVEALGYKTTDAINMSYDPANPRESTIRAFTELASRGTLRKFVEEIQERVAAIGGKEFADRLAAGKGGERDVQRLLVLGKSQAEARRLAAGQGTHAEYDAVGRSVPSSTVGANLSRAERSWVENTRALKPINAIASYAHNTIRNAAMQGKAFLSTMGTLADPSLTNAQRAKRAFAATRHLTGFVVGKSLQGAMQYFLMSSLIGGKTGASIAASEAEDDPAKFALTSFIMATVGGPYAAAGRALFGDGDISAISPQLSVALQFKDALAGEGRYRDMPIEERMKAIGERVLPASKYIRGIAVATGLASEESRNIDISRAAYWRWRREFDKPVNWGADLKDDNGYRTALKSAYLDMTRGGDPEVVSKKVLAAIGGEDAIGKDKKKAAESIRRRMLLTAPAVKGKLDALKSRIGDKAYKTLETHDALLESLADSVQRGG